MVKIGSLGDALEPFLFDDAASDSADHFMGMGLVAQLAEGGWFK